MQRECNDVAFGELTLSTRLKRNKKKIHPSLKSWYRRSVQLLNMSCRWAPPQEGVAFTTVLQRIARVFTNQYINSSNTSLALESWTWQYLEMCQTSQTERRMSSLLQDGRQQDDMMMTTNKWPLVMMWSKTAPKGTKRALPHQQWRHRLANRRDSTNHKIKQR